MPLLTTPKQLDQRSELYHQLGSLTAAGVGLLQALELLHRSPPSPRFRQPLARLMSQLDQGSTFAEALPQSGRWMPSFDVALIQAGEQSGRLDACFRLLADYYRERSSVARRVLADLAYPVFVLHAAVFIFPFAQFYITGNWSVYLRQTLGVLIPIYAGTLLLLYAGQGRHGERWRALMEWVLDPIPLLGTARHGLALARLAAALEALISAGVPIINAWELAATASGSPALRRAVAAWKPRLQAGETPAEAIRQSWPFPELFANLYQTGEVSGKLDDTLRRLHALYQEEGTRKLHAFSQWLPRLLYFGLMLIIAYKVIQFYTGYFRQLDQVLKP